MTLTNQELVDENKSCYSHPSAAFLQAFFNPLHPNISIHIHLTALFTFPTVTDKENLFQNQGLIQILIISLILVTLMFGSPVIM